MACHRATECAIWSYRAADDRAFIALSFRHPTTIADVKTRHIHNDAGILTGFEVGNGLLTRRRACRLARRVRGAIVSRRPRLFPFRYFGEPDDDFCAFSVDGVSFLIIEPFGDNDCYWIVAEDPDPAAQPLIERVRRVFAAAW